MTTKIQEKLLCTARGLTDGLVLHPEPPTLIAILLTYPRLARLARPYTFTAHINILLYVFFISVIYSQIQWSEHLLVRLKMLKGRCKSFWEKKIKVQAQPSIEFDCDCCCSVSITSLHMCPTFFISGVLLILTRLTKEQSRQHRIMTSYCRNFFILPTS